MNRTVTASTSLNVTGPSSPFRSPHIIVDVRDYSPQAGLPRMAVAQKFHGTNTAQADVPENFQPIIAPLRLRSRFHPEKRAAIRALFLTALVISFTAVFVVMQRPAPVAADSAKSKPAPSVFKDLGVQMEKLWNQQTTGRSGRGD